MTNVHLRFLSSLALAPAVLGIVWAGGVVYPILIVVALLVALKEWFGLTHAAARPRVKLMGYAGLSASLLSATAWGWEAGTLLSLVVWFFVLLAAGRFADRDRAAHFSRAIRLSAGIPYLCFSGIALVVLRGGEDGLFNLLYLVLVVWGTDIGAYCAGKGIGGPKMWRRISPNKTWAGLIGGMALAGLMGYLVGAGFGKGNLVWAASFAVLLAVVAQAGDFFESAVKRRAGVKDSGTLIPGHGGVLDRIDGLLFAAVAMALVTEAMK